MTNTRLRVLVNLPAGFFAHPFLMPLWNDLEAFADVSQVSCNTCDELRPHLAGIDALLMWSWPKLSSELLDEFPNLRFSGNIDITQDAAKVLLSRGIPVSVSRRGFSPAVAEMALLLILECLRRTPTFHAQMWRGEERWIAKFPDDIDADERQLSGRRVGLIGFGGVGQRLAQLLSPFECDIQIHDPFLPAATSTDFAVRNVSLHELIAHAEILVLCASANSGTRHLLEAHHIQSLAPKTILVNVARAALVDSQALLARLQRGDIYAALDVFEDEPLSRDSPFRELPNAYLTPHRAGGVMESVARILDFLIDDLKAWHDQRPRRHALSESMIPTLDA